MQIPGTEPVVVMDTKGQVWGFSLINRDAAIVVYVSGDHDALARAIVAPSLFANVPPPDRGRQIPAAGGNWDVPRFNGKLWAIALTGGVAPTANLAVETWAVEKP